MRKIFLSATMLLALAACNKDKSTTITTSDGKEIKITADGKNSSESGSITFQGEDGAGKINFGDAAAKQGLPLDMPVFPGGEVKGTFMSGSNGESGGMATVMASATPAKVVDFYKAEALNRGFKIKSQAVTTTDKGEMSSFMAEGANKESLAITATPSDEGGTVAVIIGGSRK